LRRHRAAPGQALAVRLAARPPYNAAWVLGFLEKRALTGVEWVEGSVWRRRIPARDGGTTTVEVRWRGDGFEFAVPADARESMADLLRRVRRVFDLGADSDHIDAHLAADTMLAPWIREAPGLRVPGAWDGFETGVRAILGQQVSVAAATTLANRLIAAYGRDGLFPGAAALAGVNPAAIGIPGKRGEAIGALARAVACGDLELDECAEPEALREALCALPGVGPWTAAYVALRVARDPDAFPDSDWVVMKLLGTTAAGARRRAANWAPWRGYALMVLWYAAGQRRLGG
jgi:AraC family transcriptional regulator of adaptative response / DNA-3-methyladenine glycosylase II